MEWGNSNQSSVWPEFSFHRRRAGLVWQKRLVSPGFNPSPSLGSFFARGILMAKRVAFLVLFMGGICLMTGGSVLGQPAKAPEWTHGLELKARKADEKEFSDKTRVFGGEAYLDRNV